MWYLGGGGGLGGELVPLVDADEGGEEVRGRGRVVHAHVLAQVKRDHTGRA